VYKIVKRPSGYLLTFSGFMPVEEMRQFEEESRKSLATMIGSFGVIADLRDLKPLPQDAQEVMVRAQALYQKKGMVRSAVVLKDAMTTHQFMRLAKESGIYDWERYVDASAVADWDKVAIAWVRDGTDPDKG